jgi:DNA-binding response OmpR family regulator
MKVLVVEDEPTLLETLTYNLSRQNYQVETATDGQQAVELAREIHPDLIVLDLMLPKLDGFEVCRILRQEMNTPILILTARDDEIDRVIGLELGADDYMSKPFSMREFLARVKAQLRRAIKIESSHLGVIQTRVAVQSGLDKWAQFRIGQHQSDFVKLLTSRLVHLSEIAPCRQVCLPTQIDNREHQSDGRDNLADEVRLF